MLTAAIDGLGDQRSLVAAGRAGRRALRFGAPAAPPCLIRAMVPGGHRRTSSSLARVLLARPAAPLLEGDECTGVDDSVGRQAALADVEFAAACGGGGARPHHARIQRDRRLVIADRPHQLGDLGTRGPRAARHGSDLEAHHRAGHRVAKPHRQPVGDRDGMGARVADEHPVHARIDGAPRPVDELQPRVYAGDPRVIDLHLGVRVTADRGRPRPRRDDDTTTGRSERPGNPVRRSTLSSSSSEVPQRRGLQASAQRRNRSQTRCTAMAWGQSTRSTSVRRCVFEAEVTVSSLHLWVTQSMPLGRPAVEGKGGFYMRLCASYAIELAGGGRRFLGLHPCRIGEVPRLAFIQTIALLRFVL